MGKQLNLVQSVNLLKGSPEAPCACWQSTRLLLTKVGCVYRTQACRCGMRMWLAVRGQPPGARRKRAWPGWTPNSSIWNTWTHPLGIALAVCLAGLLWVSCA